MLIDFFPASDVVNRVISEFISPGQVSFSQNLESGNNSMTTVFQPHPALLAGVLKQIFRAAVSQVLLVWLNAFISSGEFTVFSKTLSGPARDVDGMGSCQPSQFHQKSSSLTFYLVINFSWVFFFLTFCTYKVSVLLLPRRLSKPMATSNVPPPPTSPASSFPKFSTDFLLLHTSRGQALVLPGSGGLLRGLVRPEAEGEVHPDLRVRGRARQSLCRPSCHGGA